MVVNKLHSESIFPQIQNHYNNFDGLELLSFQLTEICAIIIVSVPVITKLKSYEMAAIMPT